MKLRYMRLLNAFVRIALAVIVTLGLASCGDDVPRRGWGAYAWSIEGKRVIWFSQGWESQRDCIESIRYVVSNAQGNATYAEPVGCGYSGNSYISVWLKNAFWGGNQIQCVAKSTDPDARKINSLYYPLLDWEPAIGQTYYCM